MRNCLTILIILVLSSTGDINAAVDPQKRLSKEVVPTKYVLAIYPDLQNERFHGTVRIDLEVLKDRNNIVLHAKNLNVASVRLTSCKTQMEITIKSVNILEACEMLIVETTPPLCPGKYFLKMNFSGSLTRNMQGFYLSSYYNPEHQVARKLAVTQFEPLYARRAFPCFDEPSFKAVFYIRILHCGKPNYHALSNMPITQVGQLQSNPDITFTYFDASPPMSTYLAAFVISDFKCSTSSIRLLNGKQIPLNVYARPNYQNKVEFAKKVACRAMEFYMKCLKIDYPLAKLDLVAVPDFAAGAMENWGLITFRETEILQSAEYSSCSNTRSVSLTIAHELAHMWFGNLVTMKWWNDLWLNEGFATYMEHMAVDFIFPEWNQMASFPLYTKYFAMKYDKKCNVRPIIKYTEDPEEVEELFDRISYQKAAAVIRMVEDAVGNTKFIYGIRNYLERYRFRNAESRELFEVLRECARCTIDIIGFMNRWTNLPGFPVVNVRRDSTIIKLSQRRFIFNRKPDHPVTETWDIPIKYITSRKEDGVKLDWFVANSSCAELSVESPIDWIKINHNSVGYYIVNYTEDAWTKFGELLSQDLQALCPTDRADLLHDAFLLADATDLCYSVVMNLASYLEKETAYQPWVVATEWLLRVNRLLDATDMHHSFQSYARHLIEEIYQKCGWKVEKEDSFTKRELRVTILNAACSLGLEDCLKVAAEKLRNCLKGGGAKGISPDVRSIVYSFGLTTQSDDCRSIFEDMLRLFTRENDAQEKERLIIALTSVGDKAILKRLVEKVINEDLVQKQDFFEVLTKIAFNPAGLDLVWNLICSNWAEITRKHGANTHASRSTIASITSLFKDEQKLHEVKQFFEKYPAIGRTGNTKKAVFEEIENNINWLNVNQPSIESWLSQKGFN